MSVSFVAKKTRSNPLIMHINPIGLLRLAHDNEERFNRFNVILNSVQTSGGNIAVPTYSYSYTKNEIYDIKTTPSCLDDVSEYLRKKNVIKRTADPNFSYLLFGDDFSTDHYKVDDYASFGNGGLIEDVFLHDGYLGAIGGALEYLTEVHFIEKKLDVDYRFDKKFDGVSIDYSGTKKNSTTTFYCRDLKLDYGVSLVRMKHDLIKEGLIEKWNIADYNLKIEVIKFCDLYNFIKVKLIDNPKYLCLE